MKSASFNDRLRKSARDFVLGVQPIFEKKLDVTVHPVEDLNSTQLATKLDQSGIDAFYYDKQGQMRGLASRVNYSAMFATRPAFTFRLALFDSVTGTWDFNREYQRKLDAARRPEEFILFPKFHIESFSKEAGCGAITWSFAAKTREVVTYISENMDNREKVRVFEPKSGEPRQVVVVDIRRYAREYKVLELTSNVGG